MSAHEGDGITDHGAARSVVGTVKRSELPEASADRNTTGLDPDLYDALERGKISMRRAQAEQQNRTRRETYPEPPTDPALDTECEGCS